MEYVQVRIEKPSHTRSYEYTLDKNLYPHEARIMNLSYSGNIWYLFVYAASMLDFRLEGPSRSVGIFA